MEEDVLSLHRKGDQTRINGLQQTQKESERRRRAAGQEPGPQQRQFALQMVVSQRSAFPLMPS